MTSIHSYRNLQKNLRKFLDSVLRFKAKVVDLILTTIKVKKVSLVL